LGPGNLVHRLYGLNLDKYCDSNFVSGVPWRIPLYLLCSVAVLGQYRLPVDQYWRGLIVMLVAYEVQYSVINGIGQYYTNDNLDTAASNIAGAAGGVAVACVTSWVVNTCRDFYSARLLQKNPNESSSKLGNFAYILMRFVVKINSTLRIGRQSDILKLEMERKLKSQHKELNDPSHPRDYIALPAAEEHLFIETVVGSQDINIWAILMPAVYQLVPGSIIAKLWFHSIFPPPTTEKVSETSQESVFSNLMVISASLALGLIAGFNLVQSFTFILRHLTKYRSKESESTRNRKQGMMKGMYSSPDDDPKSVHDDVEENTVG